ncbi:MAG TPA: thioesterase family protein [Acidimicrobiia bacterium]|nr:thioesterase family protein [Acidimicrobiia bacterium]
MTYTFAEDSRLTALSDGLYQAEVSERWSIGGRPNGGYLMGIALNALILESPHPDPLTATGHFLSAAEPGPATVDVEMIKRGRSVSTARAVLRQNDRSRVELLATMGDLDGQTGPSRMLSAPPDLAANLVSSQGRPAPHPIVERFEFALPAEQAQVAAGIVDPAQERAEFAGKIRFADGMTPTMASLPLLVDAYPPAVFNLGLLGWTPTIELTVHARGRPRGQWQILRVYTRHLIGGLLEEDAELWNEDGSLVAQSRQLARVLV